MKLNILIIWCFAMAISCCGTVHIANQESIVQKKAREELNEALSKMGLDTNKQKFILKVDPALKKQEWRIRKLNGEIELSGGSDLGVLYSVYHYLEDVCSVRFWTPLEEFYPKYVKYPEFKGEIRGMPAFEVRDFYSVYGNDRGRFSARTRLNGDGDGRIEAEFGGYKLFGPPYNCHTFNFYVPANKYFKTNPEWFSMIDGKRTPGVAPHNSQLCLSNKELRAFIKKRLREYIALGIANAQKKNIPQPRIYDISQNDNQRYCRCPQCDAITKREGAQSGIMLDFINEIADDVAKDYPEILLSTFAYQYTESLPKTIRPRNNVLIVLCDTVSNSSRPLTDSQNSYFARLLESWTKVTKNIRIWDYAITFKQPRGLPYNNEWAIQSDMQLFKKYNVNQIFTEIEYPEISDARDYKLYLRARLMENPNADFKKLSIDFANGFYGSAGKLFLQYRDLLLASQKKRQPHINMFPAPEAFTHLDLETLQNADKIFERGTKLLAGKEEYLKQWNHARLSVDRAIMARRRNLKMEYIKRHKTLQGYPFKSQVYIERIKKTWMEQAEKRAKLNKKMYDQSLIDLKKELDSYAKPVSPKTLSVPEKFKNIPVERIFDYTADISDRYNNVFELVEDSEAESGVCGRLKFPNAGGNEHKIETYKLPMVIGIYSPSIKQNVWVRTIGRHMVKKGYNWYSLGTTKLTSDSLMFFTWSWHMSFQISNAFDPNFEDGEYEVHISAKFTGSEFIKGDNRNPNAIYIERLCLIKK